MHLKNLIHIAGFILAASLMVGCVSQTASTLPAESATINSQLTSKKSMLVKGVSGIAEFTKVAELGAPDKCILDVRNTKELSDGMFAGAI